MANMCSFLHRVNVDSYKFLVEMGFSSRMAAAALRQANNDMNNALQVRIPCDLEFLKVLRSCSKSQREAFFSGTRWLSERLLYRLGS